MKLGALSVVTGLLASCAHTGTPPASRASDYLYVWAQPVDTTRPSFLGVIRIGEQAGTLERVVPVDPPGRAAHHTSYEVGDDNLLFANAFDSGRTFVFDLSDAAQPRIVARLGDAGPYSHPHSYARLPNGNAIATFQSRIGGGLPGGLVELDTQGRVLRWASASTGGADSLQIVPYSLVVLPHLDRIVSTSTHMDEDIGVHVQVWRMSDLKLLRTLEVPHAAAHGDHASHAGEHHRLPGEPRVLADGRTVMFGTFTCGLYHLTGVDTDQPKLVFSQAFPGENCAVPVVVGKYWIQTVPALRAVVALDVSQPAQPVEASRMVFPDSVAPHWLAADASGRRLVMSSASRKDPTIYMIDFDPATGALSRRMQAPLVDLRNVTWSDGSRVSAVPHGIVFGLRPGSLRQDSKFD